MHHQVAGAVLAEALAVVVARHRSIVICVAREHQRVKIGLRCDLGREIVLLVSLSVEEKLCCIINRILIVLGIVFVSFG